MRTNVINKGNININEDIKSFVSTSIGEEDLEVLSRISNGPNGFNISKIFPKNLIPQDIKSILNHKKEPLLISFYNVGWHDDKKFATKTYPWFIVYVLETHGNEFIFDIGKRGLKESVMLKEGDIYLINTQVKHRVKYQGDINDKPCSLLVFNTNIRY